MTRRLVSIAALVVSAAIPARARVGVPRDGRPSYQANIAPCGTASRNVPDISLNADWFNHPQTSAQSVNLSAVTTGELDAWIRMSLTF